MAMEPPFHMANFHGFPPKPGRHAMVTVPWWTARSAAGEMEMAIKYYAIWIYMEV